MTLSKDLRGLMLGEGTVFNPICLLFSLGPVVWSSGSYSDVTLYRVHWGGGVAPEPHPADKEAVSHLCA